MAIDKIAVLRLSPESLSRFAQAAERAPEGWSAHAGEGGAPFGARALADGVLVMPFAGFSSADELALHLRLILGSALDEHDDERGICVIAEDAAPAEGRYDDLVAKGTWIAKVAADDPRLPKGAGWSFEEAAKGLLATMPEAGARAAAKAGEDPLAQAEDRFGQIFAAREERGALRRTLSAALDGSISDSALGDFEAERPTESDLAKEAPAMADVLTRATKSDPKKASAMEAMLREAVDHEIRDVASGGEPAAKEPNQESKADESADE